MPRGWPTPKSAFDVLEKKLEEFPSPREKLAVIDYWMGLLFDKRAEIQSAKYRRAKKGGTA